MKAAARKIYNWTRRALRAELARQTRSGRQPGTVAEETLVERAKAKRARRGAFRLLTWTGARA